MTRVCWLLLVLLRSSYLLGSFIPRQGIRPRSEIDLSTEKQVVFCAGQNKSLECLSPGSTIAIMDTFWGRLSSKICPSEDGDPNTSCGNEQATTPLLRKLCDDKVYCEIPARHTILQNPGTVHCPGVNKYLIVNYTCVPIEHKLVLCDGETTKLQCRENWKLNLIEAFWGRASPTTCIATLGHPTRTGRCKSPNTTLNTVKQLCQGNANCVVRADAAHMTRGVEHCPDVDKYAIIRYRCQPNVPVQVPVTTVPTFSSSKDNLKITETNKQKSYSPLLPHVPTIMQTTKSDPSSTEVPTNKASIDGLLEEYMNSQKPTNEKEVQEINFPHDATPSPPPKEQISVPQDSSQVDLKQDIEMLKKILRSKELMKVGSKAFKGINEASATMHGSFSEDEAAKNVNNELHLSLSEEELRHLARSPDAIKIISEFIDKEKQKKAVFASEKGHATIAGSQNATPVAPSPTTKPTPSKLPIKDLDPTAKLGGKIMGNLLYEKFLKPAQDQSDEQPTPATNTLHGNQIIILKEKISALQAISDALKLITSKLDNAQKHVVGPHFDVGTLEVSEDVNQKDVKYLQDKINRAIETTEEMSREEALKLKAKAVEDISGTTRDNVLDAKEKLQIDTEIKDIEDTFNEFIKRAEKSGMLQGFQGTPTQSLFQQMQSGAFKMDFSDGKAKKEEKKTKGGTYGFEVDTQEPIISIVTPKDTGGKGKTVQTPPIQPSPAISIQAPVNSEVQSTNTDNTATQKPVTKPVDSALQKLTKQVETSAQKLTKQVETSAQKLTKLPSGDVTKAVNSIANATNRQGNASYYISLKPITTYDNLQQDVSLGGRINSEIIKEKEKAEKLYHGKDVKTLLNNLNPRPTTKAPSLSIKLLDNEDKSKEKAPSLNITVLNGTNPGDEKVKTVGKLDENTVKLLSIVVQGYLDKTKKRHHRRRKRKHPKIPITFEQEDITIGTKHDQVKPKGSKMKPLDGEVLNMLEEQLADSQTNWRMGNVVSNAEENDINDSEDMKSLPSDREDEADHEQQDEGELPDDILQESKTKPVQPMSDAEQSINKYTADRARSINSLVHDLKEMIKEGTKDEKDVKQPSVRNSKPSVSAPPKAKAHVIHFSGATTSGKIIDIVDQGSKPVSKEPQIMYAGGRIAEEGKPVMKPVSQAALAAINLTPTTKSSVGTTPSSRSRVKLKKLVTGVKRLLKALRVSVSRDLENENKLNEHDYIENEKEGSKDNDSVYRDLGKQNLSFQPKTNGYYNDHVVQDGSEVDQGYKAFYKPDKPNYELGEQFDMNLARQYAANPKEYSTFSSERYSSPYMGYPMQQPASYASFLPNQVSSYTETLPKQAKHALTSALTNDPIIQAVEEFSSNESKLYNERFQGIQRNAIPHPDRKTS